MTGARFGPLRTARTLMHRIWRRLYVLRHPDHPWLDPRAIAILDGLLNTQMTALEWGSGRSTTWLAARVGHLVSVEHNPSWHARVRATIAERGLSNVDQRLIEVRDEAAVYWGEHAYAMVAEEFGDASLDLVLVDGMLRQNCVARVLPKIRPGGYLVIDNARFVPSLSDWQVPAEWTLVHFRKQRFFDTAIWRR